MLNICTLSVPIPPRLNSRLPFPEPPFSLPPEELESHTVKALEVLRKILLLIHDRP